MSSVGTDWISSVEMKVIYRRSTVRSWANWAALSPLQSFTLPRHVGATLAIPCSSKIWREDSHFCQAASCCHPCKVHWGRVKSPQALTGSVGGSLFPHSSSCQSRSPPSCPGSAARAPRAAPLGSAGRQTHAKKQHNFSLGLKKFGFSDIVRKNCSCLIFLQVPLLGMVHSRHLFLFIDIDSMLFTWWEKYFFVW